jgi:hypothetical protein
VDKLKPTGLLVDKKQKYKRLVFTEEKIDEAGARLEHVRIKLLKCLVHETGASKYSARTATEMLKLRRYKKSNPTYSLQVHHPSTKVHFYSWFLQFVVEGEIDLQLAFFLMKSRFTCRYTKILKIIATGVHSIHT